MHARNFINLIGQKFGRLTVVAEAEHVHGKGTAWVVRCKCGNQKIVQGSNLANGHTQSCGCYRREASAARLFIDLTGQHIGQLVIVKQAHVENKKMAWVVRCKCGNQKVINGGNLTSGNTQSCGCLQREIVAKVNARHGQTNTRLYRVWTAIRERCTNPHCKAFPNYGGRGITCEFSSFEEFCAEIGEQPGPQLWVERIDNNLPYQKGNIRWATIEEQMNNKRNNRRFVYNDHTYTLAELAKHFGISYFTFRARIDMGWSIDRAGETPVRKFTRHV